MEFFFEINMIQYSRLLLLSFVLYSCSPNYDSKTPNSEGNKYHFKRIFKLNITPDVKEILGYREDFLDVSTYLTFYCNKKTSQKIKENFIIDKSQSNLYFKNFPLAGAEPHFNWWQEKETDTLIQNKSTNNTDRYKEYYWYDSIRKKGFYFAFSL